MRTLLTLATSLALTGSGISQDVVFPEGVTSVRRPLVMLSNGNFPGLPCVELEVNGIPALFLIDSGFGQTAIDKELARELELEKRGQDIVVGIGDTRKQPVYRGAVINIEGVEFEPRLIYGLPLQRFSSGRAQRIRGLIGGEFFAKCVLTIDYADREFLLHDPDSFEPTTTAVEHRLQFSLGQPEIRAAIDDGRALRYLLDTGAEVHALLFPAFVARHDLADNPSHLVPSAIQGHNTAKSAFFGRLARLSLGELTTADVPVMLMSGVDGLAFGADTRRAGILGSAMFAHGKLTFDYRGRRIFIEHDSSARLLPASGFTVTQRGKGNTNDLRVGHTLELPGAAPLDLRVGERIVAVDDAPAPFDPGDLYATVTSQPQTRLTVEREDGSHEHIVWQRLGKLPRVALPKR